MSYDNPPARGDIGKVIFCVLWIHLPLAEPVYLGNHLFHAACAMEPGTCHGAGATEIEALMAAREARAKMKGQLGSSHG